jgi:uncharacterized protein YndB with AHSA1/START domain
VPRLTHTLVVERPAADVFDALTAFERIPEWIPSIDRAYLDSPGPASAGTVFVEELRFLGRPARFVGTLTDYEPARRLRYVYETGPILGAWTYDLAAEGGTTRLAFELDVPSGRFFSTGNPLVFPFVRREVRKNLASFKAWVEGPRAA